MNKQYLKFFDYEVAIQLENSGFSYIKETLNGGQEVYCFEDCDELRAEIQNMEFSENETVNFIEDDTLSF